MTLQILPAYGQEDRENTFIIEGEDRQPPKSVLEYGSDTDETNAIGTSDQPDAPVPEEIDDPTLDKAPLLPDPPEAKGDAQTAVDEFGRLEMMAIGLGAVAILLVL
jgi:hypothetical protein